MRINHNIAALNTYRQLSLNTTSGSKSLEKLSSGFRINRAGDDAAGLAISEKMRGQIRGLNQASRNAQDGISLIQTAEGALDETHAILQRMRELAVQSATDTNTEADRSNIQDEIDQLASEITRISETTQFNTMNLLDGSFGDKKFHIGANSEQNVDLAIKNMSAEALKVAGGGRELATKVTDIEFKGVAVTNALKVGDNIIAVDIDGTYYAVEDVVVDAEGGLVAVKDAKEYTLKTDGTTFDGKLVTEGKILMGDVAVDVLKDDSGAVVAAKLDSAYYVLEDIELNAEGTAVVAKTGATDLVSSVEGAQEYIETTKGGINVSTQPAADKAITTINDALENVSKERSKLGAIQNRLEHTIKNLDTSAENLQASEARIRDVDMAKEMMEFTKNNILTQAAQAMLAQANAQPQGVLQLLS